LNGRLVFLAVAVVLLLTFLVPAVLSAQGLGAIRRAGDYSRSLLSGGMKRTFMLHVPRGWEKQQPVPLVLVLHGGGGNGQRVAALTQFSAVANQQGFVVAYPDGINGHWNDGRKVQNFRAQRENIDDVEFIRALISRLVQQLNLDSTRVYVTGMSNGAMMCYRLGCELPDKLAAIAPVCGAAPEDLPDSCPDGSPIPVLATNGTRDPFVPWQGGGVGLLTKRGRVLSVPASIQFWVKRNLSVAPAVITELPDKDPDDGISVRREVYAAGHHGAEVVFYAVEGGGHTWPGGSERSTRFGRQSMDFNASEAIWEFFRRHSRHSVGVR
jgi:polyhydroxybutyrate depolymerase